LVYSGGIRTVPCNIKLSEFSSKPFCRGEKMLRILFHGTKIEENTWNSVLNHSAEKTATHSVPGNKNKANSLNSILKHFTEENTLSILFV
jgi:hypothetical protein